MALAADTSVQLGDKESLRSRNDAFSFWKLPENWRDSISNSIDKSKIQAEHFLLERYVNFIERRRAERSSSRNGQIERIASRLADRFESHSRMRPTFPRWPCETALIGYWRRWLSDALAELRLSDGWHMAFWPEGAQCSIVLTHDICNATDLAQVEEICDIEELLGFRSAWYLPVEDIQVDWQRIHEFQARGFEFGIRGIGSNQKIPGDGKDLRKLKPRQERAIRDHDCHGFRAPSLFRDVSWIGGLDFDFDASFCDTDPFDARPGGTCSVFPFFIGKLVELPITLGRDHTLIQLLRRNPLSTWSLKAHWLANAGAMIHLATEPRYLSIASYGGAYKNLLTEFSDLKAWHALPSAVASWWRLRDEASLLISQTNPILAGSAVASLTIQRLSETPLFQ
jgi:hypothetical protein